jgi:hypothetical protein
MEPNASNEDEENEVFDVSAILGMDETCFQDHEEDYGEDDESVVSEADKIEDSEFSNEKLTHIVSLMRPMIHYDKGHEEMNEEFLKELVRKGLYGFRYNIGTSEEIADAENELLKHGFFTSTHDNKRRSLSISTYRSSLYRIMAIMIGISIFSTFFDWIEMAFDGIITKVWAFHFLQDGGGKFVFHRDRFKSKLRLILTIGDSRKGKLMRFINKQTGKSVALKIPHGTVIAMSRVVAGADRERGWMYFHEVRNCQGTYSFGMQVNKFSRNITCQKSGGEICPDQLYGSHRLIIGGK